MKTNFSFTSAALADLNDIIEYTFDKFGERQTEKYIGQLEECSNQLANGEGKALLDVHPQLRYTRCQHHYIFGIVREDEVLIVTIFHERMDLINRIAHRLDSK